VTSFSAFSVLDFLIAAAFVEPFAAGALVPGFVGVLVVGVVFFNVGVVRVVGCRVGAGFDVVLAVAVAGLDGVFVVDVALGVAALGLGLDKGVREVAVLVGAGELFTVPFWAAACAFLVALAALSLLVLVGLGLKVLGTGEGLVKGVVLVDNGVLAVGVVDVFEVPAVAGLEVGVVFGVVELGLAVWGLAAGVLGVGFAVVALDVVGLVVGRFVADVGLDTPFVCGFVPDPGLLALAVGAEPTVVFGAVVFCFAGGTDRLDADDWPPAVPVLLTGVLGADDVWARGLGFGVAFAASVFFTAGEVVFALPAVLLLTVPALLAAGLDVAFFAAGTLALDSGTSSFFGSSTGNTIGTGSFPISMLPCLTSLVVSVFCSTKFAFNS